VGKDLSQQQPPPPPPPLPTKRTGYPLAAGTLAIIASGIEAPLIVLLFVGAVGSLWVLMGVFGLVVFAFGLTGGIFSIVRKHFGLSIFGMSLLTLMGFFRLLLPALFGEPLIVGLYVGIPIIIPSILSVIFAALSKSEFT
jgi:hypothetical protein